MNASQSAAASPVRAFILETISDVYRAPVPEQSIWRWADAHVVLDAKASPRAGPYRSRETPWVRRFTDLPATLAFNEALVMKSSRTGFTEAALNVLRFMPKNWPGNALYAIDSRLEAANISNDRLLLDDHLGAEAPDDPDDDATYVKRLGNMTVWITGSYSAGTFRNKWLRTAVLDEIEVNPEIPGEGTTVDLARSRFTGVAGARLFGMSKPKKFGSSFHKEIASGTCEVFLVPCPHCGTHQELTFDGTSATDTLHIEKITGRLECKPAPLGKIVYEPCRNLLNEYDKARFPSEVHYQCCACAQPIFERDTITPEILATPRAEFFSDEVRELLAQGITLAVKQAMALSGHWLQTNPTPYPGRCTQHISDLYSSYDEVSWANLALKWIDCPDDEKKNHFRNNHLGLPAREVLVTVTEALIRDHISPYKRGQLPWWPHLVTLNWDTQDDIIEWGILGFRLTHTNFPEVAVAQEGTIFDPAELLQILGTPIEAPGPDGKTETLRCLFGLGDAGGHRTADIYTTCLAAPGRLFPCFGRGAVQMQVPLRQRPFQHGTQQVIGYLFSDDQFKHRLYIEMIAALPALRKLDGADKTAPRPRLHLPLDATSKFILGLTKERRIQDGMGAAWAENVRGNESGDIVKIGLVGFEFSRPILERRRAVARELGRATAEKGQPLGHAPDETFRADYEAAWKEWHAQRNSSPPAAAAPPA